MRLAVDWGEARIGVAACDPRGTLAYPVETVPAGARALARLVALTAEYEPLEVVVGFPRALDGSEGPAAGRVRGHAQRLVQALAAAGAPVPVRLVDERMSTVTASRRLHAGGRDTRRQRSVIDQAAAVAILEHALEGEVAQRRPPGELVSGDFDQRMPR